MSNSNTSPPSTGPTSPVPPSTTSAIPLAPVIPTEDTGNAADPVGLAVNTPVTTEATPTSTSASSSTDSLFDSLASAGVAVSSAAPALFNPSLVSQPLDTMANSVVSTANNATSTVDRSASPLLNSPLISQPLDTIASSIVSTANNAISKLGRSSSPLLSSSLISEAVPTPTDSTISGAVSTPVDRIISATDSAGSRVNRRALTSGEPVITLIGSGEPGISLSFAEAPPTPISSHIQGNSYFEASTAAQLISILSDVAMKKSEVTIMMEKYQSQLIFELYRASLHEAEIEAEKADAEIKKSNAAINGALVQMSVALATAIILAVVQIAASAVAKARSTEGKTEVSNVEGGPSSTPKSTPAPTDAASVPGSTPSPTTGKTTGSNAGGTPSPSDPNPISSTPSTGSHRHLGGTPSRDSASGRFEVTVGDGADRTTGSMATATPTNSRTQATSPPPSPGGQSDGLTGRDPGPGEVPLSATSRPTPGQAQPTTPPRLDETPSVAPSTTRGQVNPASSTLAPAGERSIDSHLAAITPTDASERTTSPAVASSIPPPPVATRDATPSASDRTPLNVSGTDRGTQVTPAAHSHVRTDGSPQITDTPETRQPTTGTRSISTTSDAKATGATAEKSKLEKSSDGTSKSLEDEITQDLEEDMSNELANDSHWSETFANYFTSEGAGSLLEVGQAIGEIITAEGEMDYQDEAATVHSSNQDTRLGFEQRSAMLSVYKNMVKAEVQAFRDSVKELASDLDATFDAIKEIAKQNKELAASGRK